MARKSFVEGIKQYAAYLEQGIAQHTANSELESIAGSIAEEGHATTLKLARDKLYDIFPEMKPAGYKTIAELDKERDSQRGSFQ